MLAGARRQCSEGGLRDEGSDAFRVTRFGQLRRFGSVISMLAGRNALIRCHTTSTGSSVIQSRARPVVDASYPLTGYGPLCLMDASGQADRIWRNRSVED